MKTPKHKVWNKIIRMLSTCENYNQLYTTDRYYHNFCRLYKDYPKYYIYSTYWFRASQRISDSQFEKGKKYEEEDERYIGFGN